MDKLFLKLHPNKVYLQHFSKGVTFLGTVIKPYRIYIKNQTKGNFYKKIKYWNDLLAERRYEFSKETLRQFLSSMNSYLGILKHYATYKLRRKMLSQHLSPNFRNYVYISDNYDKLILKNP